jgi:hypothetical protein
VTLLQPWAAAIAGGVGLGVLTLLYVLKLRRKALRVGSTLLWEQALAEVEVNTPWRRLRIDWLFVLQALAIAGLAVAVGRPAVGLGSSRQRVVVVIDVSASMAATDGAEGGKTRLAEAKRLAAEMVENLRRARGGGLEAAVVSLAGEARVVRGFTRESAGVIEGIDGIVQTDEPGNLRAAMEAIGSLTAGDAGEEENEEATVAYVFSDGGFPAETVDAPARVSVRLMRVGPEPDKPAENVGVVAISAQRDDADPATVRVVARLTSTFAAPRDVSVRLLLDDAPIGTSTVTLAPKGETTAVLPVGVRTGGVLTLKVMNDDALASDNTAGVVIDGARDPAVVVVAPGPGGKDADPLVMNFAQSVSPRSRTVGVEAVSSDAAAWKGVDLIVFDRVEPRAGVLPPVASVSLGAGLKGAGVTLVPPPASAGASERIVSWKRDHPLMRDVVLDGLVLKRAGTLTLPFRGVSLAEGLRGALIGLVEGGDGVGRVVCAFGAEQEGWGSDLSFVVFMGNAMDYLTLRGRAKAGRQFGAGDAISVRVPAGVAELGVTGPDGAERRLALAAGDSGSAVRVATLGRAERAGVYKVTGIVPGEGEDRVAVNVANAQESSLATADALPLRGGRLDANAGKAPSNRPREVWDWFVLGSLAVLGAEWLLYAALARK